MRKRIYCLAVMAGITLSATVVQAQPMMQKNLDKHFKEMDGDKDGSISKAEFDAFHDKHFRDMDSNKDSLLSQEEMRLGHQKTAAKVREKGFDEADEDKDGELSREEVKDMPRLSKGFDKMDKNKDGKLTREELEAALQKRRAAEE